jgi:hypothetical protein
MRESLNYKSSHAQEKNKKKLIRKRKKSKAKQKKGRRDPVR